MSSGIAIVLLAGGLSRRMGGGDKCLRPLSGKPILAHIIDRLRPAGHPLVLNVNGDPTRFAAFDLPVAADSVDGFPGPLAGVLSGMRWAQAHAPDVADIVTVPTDTPFVPRDLAARLVEGRAAADADLACAASGGRAHPVIGLWPVRLADALERAMTEEGIRKVDIWTGRYRLAQVDFATDPIDPFFNTNRPEDLDEAERMLPLVG